jgi:hypothetical protein
MKAWKNTLAGWLIFVLGHATLVGTRARILVTTLDSGCPSPISETTFRIIDGVILVAAFFLVAMGTFTLLSKLKWKLAITLLVLAAQVGIAYIVYIIVSLTIHTGCGGPL